MTLSDDLFQALTRIAEADMATRDDDGFLDRANERLKDLEPHELVALDLSRHMARAALLSNDIRVHYASMACLFFSGILDNEPGLGDMTLIDMMDFADQGWTGIQEIVDEAVASMVWNEEDQ